MTMTSRRMSAVKAIEDAAEAVSDTTTAISKTVKHDIDALSNGAADALETVSGKLKSVGVDTDVMATAAKDQATELQKLLADELRAHPLRALGVAAAIGVVVGLMTSR